jgi:DNA-binding XRE family transcriptional regulator
MKPQIIKKDGKPEYAVIPYDEYRQLLEDAHMLVDIMAYDTAKNAVTSRDEELIPADVVDRLLDGDNPVRVWREYRGLAAGDLAKACGVTAAAISQIESGKRRPSITLLKRIAGTLDVDLESLVVTEGDSEAA